MDSVNRQVCGFVYNWSTLSFKASEPLGLLLCIYITLSTFRSTTPIHFRVCLIVDLFASYWNIMNELSLFDAVVFTHTLRDSRPRIVMRRVVHCKSCSQSWDVHRRRSHQSHRVLRR